MTTWKDLTDADPSHSQNYARRWKVLASQGKDIHGEARLADALVERGSRILDAGCGTGRVGGELSRRGHTVVGFDLDPLLLEHAEHDFPDVDWHVGNLEKDEIPEGNFDLAISAGNVMGFITPEGREAALRNIYNSLAPSGRFVVGFGSGRGWEFDDFLGQAAAVGFGVDYTFSSWDLRPFTQNSTFLVALLSKPGANLLG